MSPTPADAPDAATLDWVAREVGDGPVVGLRRLTGGVATATHLVTLSSGRQVVLRRHHRRWAEQEPGLVAGEAVTLRHVAGADPSLPVPRLLAVDADGSASGGGGRPAMVLSKLPGRIDLAPPDPSTWLQQMAEVLARVHALPSVPVVQVAPGASDPPWFQSHVEPPSWSAHPEVWARALDVAAAGAPDPASTPASPVLVHGDFQHFNLLWSRGRLTGVVDWSGPHPRPLDSDLGHCRLNVAILFGTGIADDFLRRYEAVTSGPTIDPWWDLHETLIFLPTWAPTIARQVGARLPAATVTAHAIHQRVDAHLGSVLRRLDA